LEVRGWRVNVAMVTRTLATVIAAGVCLGASQSAGRVPASLLLSASADPFTVASLLVNAETPTGLEIRQVDRLPLRVRIEPPDWGTSVSLDQFIQSFNAAREDYVAELTNGTVAIRPRARRVQYLDARSNLTEMKLVGISRAIRTVFSPLTGDPAAGGIIGSDIASSSLSVSMEDFLGEARPIQINGVGKNNVDVLNEIVTQAPGQGWIVTTMEDAARQPQIFRYGVIRRVGSVNDGPIR
jgi:hypothetical protein